MLFRIPEHDRIAIGVRGEEHDVGAVGHERVDVVNKVDRPIDASDRGSMDRARRGQRAVVQPEDLEEALTRGQDRFPIRRVRQANRAEQGGRETVDEAGLVGELGHMESRRDRLHVVKVTNAGS